LRQTERDAFVARIIPVLNRPNRRSQEKKPTMNLHDCRSALRDITLDTGGLLFASLLQKIAAAAEGKVAAPRPCTGSEPSPGRIDPPSVGAVVRQLKGDRNGLPGAVPFPTRIGDKNTFMWTGQRAGYLGERYAPLMFIDETWIPGDLPPTFKPNPQVGEERLRVRGRRFSKPRCSRIRRPERSSGRFTMAANMAAA